MYGMQDKRINEIETLKRALDTKEESIKALESEIKAKERIRAQREAEQMERVFN